MKKCKDCHKRKPASAYYGIQGECKACTQKRVSKNYYQNRDYYIAYEKEREKDPERKRMKLEYQRVRRSKFPGKNRARQKVSNALRDGRLLRKPCDVCGSLKVEAHHKDYRKYLEVTWLCRKHHMEVENKLPF